jgi:septal ring factor EnvC (AmiA/AmiB activator)
MDLSTISIGLSILIALGGVFGGLIAYGRSNRTTESQVISVTVEAAENVVELVTAQLTRTAKDYDKLTQRLDKMEAALIEERNRTSNLTMQLGKMRKRITQLEEFIHDMGQTPPPETV